MFLQLILHKKLLSKILMLPTKTIILQNLKLKLIKTTIHLTTHYSLKNIHNEQEDKIKFGK